MSRAFSNKVENSKSFNRMNVNVSNYVNNIVRTSAKKRRRADSFKWTTVKSIKGIDFDKVDSIASNL